MIDASGRKATSELAINAQIFYAMAVAPRYGKALDFLFIIFLRLDCFFFFLNDTPPTEISPLSLHDALPIPPAGAVERLVVEFTAFVPGTAELQLFARDAQAAARAGRRRALRSAAQEIKLRLKRSLLYHV